MTDNEAIRMSPQKGNGGPVRGTDAPIRGTEGPVAGTGPFQLNETLSVALVPLPGTQTKGFFKGGFCINVRLFRAVAL